MVQDKHIYTSHILKITNQKLIFKHSIHLQLPVSADYKLAFEETLTKHLRLTKSRTMVFLSISLQSSLSMLRSRHKTASTPSEIILNIGCLGSGLVLAKALT